MLIFSGITYLTWLISMLKDGKPSYTTGKEKCNVIINMSLHMSVNDLQTILQNSQFPTKISQRFEKAPHTNIFNTEREKKGSDYLEKSFIHIKDLLVTPPVFQMLTANDKLRL